MSQFRFVSEENLLPIGFRVYHPSRGYLQEHRSDRAHTSLTPLSKKAGVSRKERGKFKRKLLTRKTEEVENLTKLLDVAQQEVRVLENEVFELEKFETDEDTLANLIFTGMRDPNATEGDLAAMLKKHSSTNKL